MNINIFKNNLDQYSTYYTPAKLFEKLKKVAMRAGIKVVYVVLILYYASLDSSLPVKDRLMVFAALGYFILPIDLIPDGLPGGFTDDMAALLYVVRHIWSNLSDETLEKAAVKLNEWFDNIDEKDLSIF